MRLTAISYGGEWTNLYEFRPLGGGEVPEFTAGAHVDLQLPNGMLRQYSIASSELDRRRYVLGIKRGQQSRGGSRFIHDALRVGELLRVSRPRNNFPLVDAAPHAVFIAGGIGVTPIRCLVDRAERIGQDWELHYAVQRREQAVFVPDFQAYGDPFRLHVDAEQDGRLIDLAAVLAGVPRDSHLYCCGPAGMLDTFLTLAAGWPAEQVHVERFTSTVPPAAEQAQGFVVELARSKRRVDIPAGRTILDMLRAAGCDVNFSCEQGICGACETKVLAGVPEHRDMLLSDEEKAKNTTMMICCSLSRSDVLVLDL
jgi:vanillate O-demethylase ferredoxin subunit